MRKLVMRKLVLTLLIALFVVPSAQAHNYWVSPKPVWTAKMVEQLNRHRAYHKVPVVLPDPLLMAGAAKFGNCEIKVGTWWPKTSVCGLRPPGWYLPYTTPLTRWFQYDHVVNCYAPSTFTPYRALRQFHLTGVHWRNPAMRWVGVFAATFHSHAGVWRNAADPNRPCTGYWVLMRDR